MTLPRNPWLPRLFLALVSLVLYANSLGGGYVLDDGIVISDNRFTTQGLAGIDDIFAHDTFVGTFGEAAELSGGRYRPLSLAMFAVEWQLFGPAPLVGHLVNVLLYALSVVILFELGRRRLFPGHDSTAFLAALLFAIHPIHTEVVANIKSRDEILVLLLLLISMLALLRSPRWGRGLLVGLGAFILALFAKESAVLFVILIPAALWTFTELGRGRIAALSWPYAVATAAFLGLRLIIVGASRARPLDVLDSPYLLASGIEKYATIVFVLGKYLWLLVWPSALTYDYSFRHIAYRGPADPAVWIAGALHVALIAIAVIGLRRRRPAGFAALLYLLSLFIVSNVIVDIGAPMGERLAYLPSLGFVMLVAIFLGYLYRARPSLRVAVTVLVCAVTVLGALRVVARNRDWRSGPTLFLADVKTAPGSARIQKAAGGVWLDRALADSGSGTRSVSLEKSIAHHRRAVAIHPGYADAYVDLGLSLLVAGDIEGAEHAMQALLRVRPDHGGIPELARGLKTAYRDLGARARERGRSALSLEYLENAARYGPEDPSIRIEIGDAHLGHGDPLPAIRAYRRAVELEPDRPASWSRLAIAFTEADSLSRAREAWSRVLALDPENRSARKALEASDPR